MTIKTSGLLGLTGLVCLLTGAARAGNDYSEEIHHTFPLSAEGKIKLDNANGQIRIVTWEKNEVKMDAIKHAPYQRDLNLIQIQTDSRPGSLGIKTQYPKKPGGLVSKKTQGSVDYVLTVPAGVTLEKIDTVNGQVKIEGVKGKVHAENVNGTIEVEGLAEQGEFSTVNGKLNVRYADSATLKNAKLTAVNGEITLSLPGSPDGTISARTVTGSIQTDLPMDVKKELVGAQLTGVLGLGGPEISLETVNGRIEVRAGRNPAQKQ